MTTQTNTAYAFLRNTAPVAQGPNGAWYITIGQPGFNTPKNNRGGYPTEAAALAVIAKLRGAR